MTARTQTAAGSMDYDEFARTMNELLQRAWGEDWGTFTEEEPVGSDGDSLTIPIITFNTFERKRSEFFKSLDPVFFGYQEDPENPDQRVKLYRMWFDIEMQFIIHHASNRSARILMEQFETFLFEYKGYFKNQGISDLIFLAEAKPTVEPSMNRTVCKRTLHYLVRIERITTIRSNIFTEIDTTVMDADTRTEDAIGEPIRLTNANPNPFLDLYQRTQFRPNE